MEKLKEPGALAQYMADQAPISPITSTTSTTGKKSSKKSSKKKQFQLNTKTLFCTWPQNETPKEKALKRIVKAWPVEWAIVAQEQHKDGNNHLHAVVRFTAPMRFGKQSFADFVATKHGNYQSARGVKASIKYVKKAGDFVVHGVLPVDQVTNREAPTTRVAKMIMAGKTLEEIKLEEPGVFFQYRKKIDEMMTYESAISQEDNLSEWCPLTPKPSMPSHKLALVKWLNENICTKEPRPFKQDQLWIVSPPGTGKTTLCTWLEKFCRIYWMPLEETFYDEYFDDRVDLVVFDEYKANKTITFMNSFLQGMCQIRKKGTQYMKRANPPCIITSNYSPEECYNKSGDTALTALHTRIQVLHWPSNEFCDVTDCLPEVQTKQVEPKSPLACDETLEVETESEEDESPVLKRSRAQYFISDDESEDEPPKKRCRFINDEASVV